MESTEGSCFFFFMMYQKEKMSSVALVNFCTAVVAPAGFGPEAKPEEASLESPRVMT